MGKLKWFIVEVDESAGYDALETYVPHIVAAPDEASALTLFPTDKYLPQPTVREWTDLPDLKRKSKPFIWL